jgi:hypothetical protein
MSMRAQNGMSGKRKGGGFGELNQAAMLPKRVSMKMPRIETEEIGTNEG